MKLPTIALAVLTADIPGCAERQADRSPFVQPQAAVTSTGPVLRTNGLPTLDLAPLGDFTAKGLQNLKATCLRVFFALILVLVAGCSTVSKSVNDPDEAIIKRLQPGMKQGEFEQVAGRSAKPRPNPSPHSSTADFDFDGWCIIAHLEHSPNAPAAIVRDFTIVRDGLTVQQREAERSQKWSAWVNAHTVKQDALAEIERLRSLTGRPAPTGLAFRTHDLRALDLANVGNFWNDDRQVREDSSRVRFPQEATYQGGLGYAGTNKHLGVAVFQSETAAVQAMEALRKDVASVIKPGDTNEFGGRRWWFTSGMPNGVYVVFRNTIVMVHCYQPPYQRSDGMLQEAAATVVARIEHEAKYSSANDRFFNSLTNRLTVAVGGQWEVRSDLLWGTKLNRAGTAEFAFNILPHPNCGPEAVKLWEYRLFYCSAPCHVMGVASNLVLTQISTNQTAALNPITELLELQPVRPSQTAEKFLEGCGLLSARYPLRLFRIVITNEAQAVQAALAFLRRERLDWGPPVRVRRTLAKWYAVEFKIGLPESERVVLVNPQDGGAEFPLLR